MALVPCPECKTEVSNKALTCPKCGCPLKGERADPSSAGPAETLSFWECFFDVWIHPSSTVRKILDNRPGYFVWPAILYCCILYSFSPEKVYGFRKTLDLNTAILASFLVISALQLLRFWFDAAFIYGVGKIFGGKGSFKEFYTAFVWAYPPCFFADLFGTANEAPNWLLVRMDPPLQPMSDLLTGWQTALSVLYNFFYIWSIVLIVANNAEAQKISKTRSFFVVLIYAVMASLVHHAFKWVFPNFYDISLKKGS